jgi:catalase
MAINRGAARAKTRASGSITEKQRQLAEVIEPSSGALTTSQGVVIADNHHSLKAGSRGPTLAEDFVLREKLGHFANERTAERVTNARGCGAHGVFQLSKALSEYTTAQFLNDAEKPTPVFVRFSNLCGERGSADTVRDIRGFAVKFYTADGNYDLVGSNVPVFYVQDAIKFPDLMHAMKPEPHTGIPQASSAHDTFWDFVSLMPETSHMLMWAMSDRALPRSYRMMAGFGVHTFRMINSRGESHFVKYHWKPRQGVHCLLREEATLLAGRDPDFLRRDLWESIDAGRFPEWDLGLQLISTAQAESLGIDLLDPTKLVPEELVPVTWVGRLTLNRNVDDFFAETEQVAFHPGHLVPGIDFTADPVLQGRIGTYREAQTARLQGPNFGQLPINRSLCPVHNFQRGGAHRQTVAHGPVSYEPHSIGGAGTEFRVDGAVAGLQIQPDALAATKMRGHDPAFDDHFSQAKLFWNSVGAVEREHICDAFAHDLAKVRTPEVRQRALNNLTHVDARLARKVAQLIGADAPDAKAAEGQAGFRDRGAQTTAPVEADELTESPSLAMQSAEPKRHLPGRRVAVLMADGVDVVVSRALQHTLAEAGLLCVTVSPAPGGVVSSGGRRVAVDTNLLLDGSSVTFDAVVVCGGEACVQALKASDVACAFLTEAYRHGKPMVAVGEGRSVLTALAVWPESDDAAVATRTSGSPVARKEADAKLQSASKPHRLGVVFYNPDPEQSEVEIAAVISALGAHRHHVRHLAEQAG